MMQMYLVQRGNFRDNVVKNVTKETCLTGKNGLIDLDYMGSAEFEFGAIPASFRIIMYEMEKYSLFPNVFYTVRGVPVNVFCRNDQRHDIVKTIHDYIEDCDPKTIRHYRLKEPIYFEHHMIDWYSTNDCFKRYYNFWWDIRNQFMFFTGAFDRQKAFYTAIYNDYYNWWMKKSETEREDNYEKALNRIY